jgi:hypothetical protein
MTRFGVDVRVALAAVQVNVAVHRKGSEGARAPSIASRWISQRVALFRFGPEKVSFS